MAQRYRIYLRTPKKGLDAYSFMFIILQLYDLIYLINTISEISRHYSLCYQLAETVLIPDNLVILYIMFYNFLR